MPLIRQLNWILAYFWQSWLNYHAPVEDKAFAFHYALAQGFAELAANQARQHQCRTIVLSGGVMHNQRATSLIKRKFERIPCTERS